MPWWFGVLITFVMLLSLPGANWVHWDVEPHNNHDTSHHNQNTRYRGCWSLGLSANHVGADTRDESAYVVREDSASFPVSSPWRFEWAGRQERVVDSGVATGGDDCDKPVHSASFTVCWTFLCYDVPQPQFSSAPSVSMRWCLYAHARPPW